MLQHLQLSLMKPAFCRIFAASAGGWRDGCSHQGHAWAPSVLNKLITHSLLSHPLRIALMQPQEVGVMAARIKDMHGLLRQHLHNQVFDAWCGLLLFAVWTCRRWA
jgi:hypothetical protein